MGFGIYLSNQWLSRFVNGYWVLWICFLYVCVDLLYYMCNVYIEIADHLKIKIFRITPQVAAAPEKQAPALKASTGVRTRSQVKKSD
jgi:hypothetical protein